MTSTLVMTVIGPDRPGLVQLVASRVADNGGNWLESRMCHLGGQFAGILRVEVARERAAGLLKALATLEADGLKVIVNPGDSAAVSDGARIVEIALVGQDRPGILRSIASVLAAHRVNVEDLTSERVNTPMGGGTLFQARAMVTVPAPTELGALRADLEKIAADLMIDLQIQPVASKS